MVKLTKIYTKTGDDGTTGLGTGARVAKSSRRVEAYGAVDEANAALGLAVVACGEAGGGTNAGVTNAEAIAPVLTAAQQDLFDVGADLCVPVVAGETGKLRILPAQTARLEGTIDRFNAGLSPLTSFVLPGGSALAGALHLARTIVRRAEREVVRLIEAEPAGVSPEVVKYLNRLSDLLFVLSRVANDNGRGDVLWVPGANRGGA
ncbi:MAG: cob(I)yrinic acid a,c-diamide adenosyltransferase [Phycisphaerales bacterium]